MIIRLAIVAHDEDDVAFIAVVTATELPQVDTAQPVIGNIDGGRLLPIALPKAMIGDGRRGLIRYGKRSERCHVATAPSSIVTHTVHPMVTAPAYLH